MKGLAGKSGAQGAHGVIYRINNFDILILAEPLKNSSVKYNLPGYNDICLYIVTRASVYRILFVYTSARRHIV